MSETEQRDAAGGVYAVTVNWERPQDTIACVASLRGSDVANLHIVVVDNGSDDDSVAQIAAAETAVDLVQLPRNLGYTGGYNAGIRHALRQQASHILIINNDTTIDPAAVRLLLQSPYDVAVPKILFHDDRQRIWAAGARWRPFPPAVVMRGYGRSDDGTYDTATPLTYATGCALLVRRELFTAVGGFDELFINYNEDYDFSLRARQAGFSIGYVPQARIYHKVSLTLGEGSPRKWWFLGRNAVLFFRKAGRFSWPLLWSHLAWVSLREVVKGNGRRLPDFWRGVRNGLGVLRTGDFRDQLDVEANGNS